MCIKYRPFSRHFSRQAVLHRLLTFTSGALGVQRMTHALQRKGKMNKKKEKIIIESSVKIYIIKVLKYMLIVSKLY